MQGELASHGAGIARDTLLSLALQLLIVPCALAAAVDPEAALTPAGYSARTPAWHPHGHRIAYAAQHAVRTRIEVLDTRTGAIESVTAGEDSARMPAWSPDGTQLAFVHESGGETDLWLRDTTSGALRRLTQSREPELHPTWSPDGRTIAYARATGDSFALFRLDLAAREIRPLLEPAGHELWPRWAPDGGAIVFFSRRATRGLDDEVHVLSLAPPAVYRLTIRTGHDFCPEFDPDGDRLLVVSVNPDQTQVLRVLARDGTERARIATGLFRATEPSWSPDGRRIAFAGSAVAGAPFRIYVIEAPVD